MMTHPYLAGPLGATTLALALGPDLEPGSFIAGTIKLRIRRLSYSPVVCLLRHGKVHPGGDMLVGLSLRCSFGLLCSWVEVTMLDYLTLDGCTHL
jgi:hypothetical protein